MIHQQLATICRLILLITLLVLAISVDFSSGQRRSKCPPTREQQMDVCASRMGFLGDHSFKVPKNVTAMGPFCTELKANLQCLQSYSRDCMQGFTRQILTGILKRGKQQYSSICTDDTTKRDFLNKMACLTDDKIGQFHLCMDASIARFEYIRQGMRQENRLPGLCCSYQVFNQDIDDTIGRLCPLNVRGSNGSGNGNSQNSAKIDEFIHRIAGGTAGEFYQLICDNHRSIEECKASDKTRDSMKRLESITRQVKEGKAKPRGRSLIPVLLDILDNSDPITRRR